MPTYLVGDLRLGPEDACFGDALAGAYRSGRRPTCLCTPGDAEMYVAHLGAHFVLKRMPLSGDRHAPECPSFGCPALPSPRHSVTQAIETPAGATSIRLAFALSHGVERNNSSGNGSPNGDATQGERLSLGGLLSYLWGRAELDLWRSSFAGRRNWAVVRKRLLEAAHLTFVGGRPLSERLFIPERFNPEDRGYIQARMSTAWRQKAGPGTQHRLMLLIGEIKQIGVGRNGRYVLLKHLPVCTFGLNTETHECLRERYARELSEWRASSPIRLMLIATFNPRGIPPAIVEMSLMPAMQNWVPTVTDPIALQLPGDRLDSAAPVRRP